MFGRKKRSKPVIEVRNADQLVITRCMLADFALPEATVLALSIEYFQDPEPCEIHRAAVQRRAVMELTELCEMNRETLIAALPDAVKNFFPDDAVWVCIREGQP